MHGSTMKNYNFFIIIYLRFMNGRVQRIAVKWRGWWIVRALLSQLFSVEIAANDK